MTDQNTKSHIDQFSLVRLSLGGALLFVVCTVVAEGAFSAAHREFIQAISGVVGFLVTYAGLYFFARDEFRVDETTSLPSSDPTPSSEYDDKGETETDEDEDSYESAVYWRQEAKSYEQAFMSEKDAYSSVARALGFDSDSWFDDPYASHLEIVQRAKAFSDLAGGLQEALIPFLTYGAAFADIPDTYPVVSSADGERKITMGDIRNLVRLSKAGNSPAFPAI